jgi:hypothetical protein
MPTGLKGEKRLMSASTTAWTYLMSLASEVPHLTFAACWAILRRSSSDKANARFFAEAVGSMVLMLVQMVIR